MQKALSSDRKRALFDSRNAPRAPSPGARNADTHGRKLLDLDGSAGGNQLLLEFLGIFLGDALLDVLRATLDQSLRFLQTQTGDLADDLDDAQLLVAETGQNNVKLGLLLSGRSGSGSGAAGNSNGSSSGNAELLLDSLDQLIELQNGQSLDLLNNSGNLLASHFNIPPEM